MDPASLTLQESLDNFEQLGWVKKDKLSTKEKKAAIAAKLPEPAQKNKWQLPERKIGDMNTEGSSSKHTVKRDAKSMAPEEALWF